MRLSRYFLPILKETPKEAEIVSHRLMLRAGMIRQQSAGIYSWLPLGLKVLRKIERIVEGLIARKKFVYLCTNAILLKEKLDQGLFQPSKYLTFSIHMDGTEEAHDFAVCREGIYRVAAKSTFWRD